MPFLHSRHLTLVGATMGLALLATAVSLWPSDPAHADAASAPVTPAQPVLAVDTVQARRLDWPVELPAAGGLFAWQTASIASEVSGLRIESLLVDVGSVVRRGQPLATLARDTVAAQLRAQQANVAEARARLAQAEAQAQRSRTLQGNGTLSEQQVLEDQVSAQTARAALDAAQATLEGQELQLAHTRLLAPDDGVISARSASLGQVVGVGTELFQLLRQQRLEWRAELGGRELGQLQPGQLAQLQLPNGQSVEARLRLVAPTLDANTRLGLAYFDLPPTALQKGAAAGLYVSGRVRLGEAAASVLPNSAITLRDGNSYLFEVGPDARVRQRQVRTGLRRGDLVQVLETLAPDARFVNGGGSFLKEGDVVQMRGTPRSGAANEAAPLSAAPQARAGGAA